MGEFCLLLDEDVRPMLGDILRQRGYDAVHVVEVSRGGKSDREQLEYATEQGRAILTHNIRDYLVLDAMYRSRGMDHAGILVSDQVSLRELLHRTLSCLSQMTKDDAFNSVIWLHDFKVI